ncbi:MAG: UDP-N-acetylmuramoyl-tripeptide--D-alanyl-D-alanine ligase [Bacteroidota bacterium]
MMRLDARELLNIEHVRLQNVDRLRGKRLKGVSTDSRTVRPGDVFFAVKGERFDGHAFVAEAFSHGCTAAVVEKRLPRATQGLDNFPILFVKDSIHALGQFARWYRRKFDIPIIAVTGSNGKTTTKEMIAAVLGQEFSVLKTEGNLNNHIGVPMTLFRLDKKYGAAVVEMGTNHFGELEYLCSVAEPTHGLITNIARAHLEFFGSLEGVARAKGEAFDWLASRGVGFVNVDDPLVVERAKVLKHRFTYGFGGKRVNVRGRLLGFNEKVQPRFSFGGYPLSRPLSVQLRTYGKHTAENALAAAAVGFHFGVRARKIKSALEKHRPGTKRMEVLRIQSVTILNDTYNANPDSVRSALQTLAAMECKGRRIVVVGDMLELGDSSEREHEGVGKEIGRLGFEYVLTFGKESAATCTESHATHAYHFEEKSALTAYLEKLVEPGDVVLVKGSRGMKMEDVVIHLTEYLRAKT